jgi:hypothetical protein
MRQFLIKPKAIVFVLLLQIIPLVLFPVSSFSPSTQEWWLPVILAVMALIGGIQLVFRRSLQPWPWYLVGFAQGFNIISRLMMLMPHATYVESGVQLINTQYLVLSIISMMLSAFLLWYIEWPEVRINLVRE